MERLFSKCFILNQLSNCLNKNGFHLNVEKKVFIVNFFYYISKCIFESNEDSNHIDIFVRCENQESV